MHDGLVYLQVSSNQCKSDVSLRRMFRRGYKLWGLFRARSRGNRAADWKNYHQPMSISPRLWINGLLGWIFGRTCCQQSAGPVVGIWSSDLFPANGRPGNVPGTQAAPGRVSRPRPLVKGRLTFSTTLLTGSPVRDRGCHDSTAAAFEIQSPRVD
jgi:hypothetical protein